MSLVLRASLLLGNGLCGVHVRVCVCVMLCNTFVDYVVLCDIGVQINYVRVFA